MHIAQSVSISTIPSVHNTYHTRYVFFLEEEKMPDKVRDNGEKSLLFVPVRLSRASPITALTLMLRWFQSAKSGSS